ncbi:MAG: 3'-5' exonuclease [Ignavibacteriales bacterium]|nr:3'-5' exonuclease [Ignavibacteriales bacterium]
MPVLRLDRPLVFFDLETTGLDVTRDRVVQIAMIKYHPDGHREEKMMLIHPGIPIPPEATAVHRISNEDVRDAPSFEKSAVAILSFFQGCDVAGYNIAKFDVPLLTAEFQRSGHVFPDPDTKMADAYQIFIKKEKRDLAAAYAFYCSRKLENAHNAEADVRATLEVFMEQLERYQDLGQTLADIQRFSEPPNALDPAGKLQKNEKGDVVFTFGKNRGKRVVDCLDYARWMLGADFSTETKDILRKIITDTE